MPRWTTHNTGNIFTITLTSNQNQKKHIYKRPHDGLIITLYFSSTKRRQHLKNSMLTNNTRTLLLLCCCVAIGAAIAAAPQSSRPRQPPPQQGGYKEDYLYPLKTFYIRTSDVEANKMSHKILQNGLYHDFLEVHQIRSKACYGWNVVLKVTTDDTHFFNSKTAVWPTRPEMEWIASALNNDLSSVYYIHFLTYTIPPKMETGEERGQRQRRTSTATPHQSAWISETYTTTTMTKQTEETLTLLLYYILYDHSYHCYIYIYLCCIFLLTNTGYIAGVYRSI